MRLSVLNPAEAFLSTLSLRRATDCAFPVVAGFVFLSTLSLRRATRRSQSAAPTAGNFYPRSPCGERLGGRVYGPVDTAHFYPRSPCGERPALKTIKALFDTISIHALLAESDTVPEHVIVEYLRFLSTLSLRRATALPGWWTAGPAISIHALLAESDRSVAPLQGECMISIHALLAESDISTTLTLTGLLRFLSTLSLRRATRGPPA